MKRQLGVVVALCLAAVGCTDTPRTEQQESVAEKAWVTTPVIQEATLLDGALILAGTASPRGRVVVSEPGGEQFGVAADDRGDFRLVMPAPVLSTLYRVEVQSGQERYLAAGRLLAGGRSGPIAFVSAGAATRRFDPAPPLDAVDADGRAMILTGRSEPGEAIRVEAGVVRDVVVGRQGRWTAALAGLPGTVRIDGQAFAPWISAQGADGLSATPGGWRLIWTTPDGTRQVTWFPETPPDTFD